MSQHLDLAYTDFVKDEESLYRSVWRKDYCFFMSDEGNLCLSGEAFADKKRKPSVSRKHLCENPPYSKLPRLSDNDAVVLLTAEIIRKNANPITHKSGKNPQINHIIDVIPDIELPNHISHAVIFATPDFPTDGAFGKLKNSLAILANEWAIRPDDEFIEEIKQRHI